MSEHKHIRSLKVRGASAHAEDWAVTTALLRHVEYTECGRLLRIECERCDSHEFDRVLYRYSAKCWEPPFHFEPITEQHRQIIFYRIEAALVALGVKAKWEDRPPDDLIVIRKQL